MFGIGLRHAHFPEILQRLEDNPSSLSLDFFEIITENFFSTRGRPYKVLEVIAKEFPLTFHGVGLSIASDEGIDWAYLDKVKILSDRFSPLLVSDHLCWTGLKEHNVHNLLPFPYTRDNLQKISQKVLSVQDFMKRPLVLENLSTYLQFQSNEMTEFDFLRELHHLTGCEFLLDLNNLYVNQRNFQMNCSTELKKIPMKSVREIHLAGFSDMGEYCFDTHSEPVHESVWNLYGDIIALNKQNVLTTVEWDENIPSLDRVCDELLKAKMYR